MFNINNRCGVFILIILLLITISSSGCNNNQINSQKQEVPVMASERTQELYPSWILLKKEILNLDNSNYTILALSRKSNEFEADIRIAVCKYVNNQWVETWRIPEDIKSECYNYKTLREHPEYNLHDLLVVNDNKAAIVAANVFLGGKSNQVLAFTIDNKDNYTLKLFDSNGLMNIKKQDNCISIEGYGEYGTHKLYLENGEYKEKIITRSETTPDQSIKASFILGGYDNLIYPSGESNITCKVGDTIAFIPANQKTKQLFDNGEIEIYTDAWNEPPLTICQANKLFSGNSYTFEKAGAAQFLLIYTKNELSTNYKDIKPTFTVTVKP